MENAYVWVYIFQYIDLSCSIKNFNIFFFYIYGSINLFYQKKNHSVNFSGVFDLFKSIDVLWREDFIRYIYNRIIINLSFYY